jgi:hypothetical protein
VATRSTSAPEARTRSGFYPPSPFGKAAGSFT